MNSKNSNKSKNRKKRDSAENTDINFSDIELNKYNLDSPIPLSETQLTIFLDEEKNKRTKTYNWYYRFTFDTKYTKTDVEKALLKVIENHPILKCCITKSSSAPALKVSSTPNIKIKKKLSESQLNSFKSARFKRINSLSRFIIEDIDKGVMLHSCFHHLIYDYFSNKVFIQDMHRALENKKLRYDDDFLKISAFSNSLKNSKANKLAENYFDKSLEDLGNFRPFVASPIYSSPGKLYKQLNIDNEKLDNLLAKHNITKEIFFTAVFAFTFSKFTFNSAVEFCTTYNFRKNLGFKNSIGCIGEFAPLYINCEYDNIGDYLKHVADVYNSTMKYAYYPIRKMIERYEINTDIEFQYLAAEDIGFIKSWDDSSISDEYYTYIEKNVTLYDLMAYIVSDKDDYYFSITHTEKFPKFVTDRYAYAIQDCIDCFLQNKNLSKVGLFNINYDVEKVALNSLSSRRKMFDSNLLFYFNIKTKYMPDQKCVVYKNVTLTYRQASILIYDLCGQIKDTRTSLVDRIGILIKRSHWYFLSSLACCSSGNTYVPIDDKYPDSRIKYIIEDADTNVIITDNSLINRVRDITNSIKTNKKFKIINLDDLFEEDILSDTRISYYSEGKILDTEVNEILCILYTSGTTGNPKGTKIKGTSVLSLADNFTRQTEVNINDVFCFYSSFGFDVHLEVFYTGVYSGCAIDIAPEEIRMDIQKFGNYLDKHKITIVDLPSAFIKVFAQNYNPKILRLMIAGGETLGKIKPIGHYLLYDSYGPTECTCIVTLIQNINKLHYLSIGFTFENMKFYILDKHRNMLPTGAIGELYLSGDQVSAGYLNKPEIESKSFFKNPYNDGDESFDIMYKTGDIVTGLQDTSLMFLGREDGQAKIRGNRVELSEIENCIKQLAFIEEVTANTFKSNNVDELVVYFVADKPQNENSKNKDSYKNQILNHVRDNLPQYMVPSAVIQMDNIPKTVNGKINKKKLPDPKALEHDTKYVAPKTDTEKTICKIFKKVLTLDRVGLYDDYFKIGGSSLNAIKVVFEAKKAGLDVVYEDIYHNPTPSSLANAIDSSYNETIKDNSDIENYDYSKINNLLDNSYDISQHILVPYNINTYLLTGSTGYLGIHILNKILEKTDSDIVLVVRGQDIASAEKRLCDLYNQYFHKNLLTSYKNNMEIINGDITQKDIFNQLDTYPIDIVINCAANVKHFSANNEITKINYEGLKNIVYFCEKNNIRLLQISTVSVAGQALSDDSRKKLKESELYIGQILDNEYCHSKFLAERYILQCVAENKLNANILRLGNIMNRYTDGEFQKNIEDNAFYREYLNYVKLGAAPKSQYEKEDDFTPVDDLAGCIVDFSNFSTDIPILHTISSNNFFKGEIIDALKRNGFNIDVIADEKFKDLTKDALTTDDSNQLLGMFAYETHDDKVFLDVDTKFSRRIINRFYKWKKTDVEFYDRCVKYLIQENYFK